MALCLFTRRELVYSCGVAHITRRACYNSSIIVVYLPVEICGSLVVCILAECRWVVTGVTTWSLAEETCIVLPTKDRTYWFGSCGRCEAFSELCRFKFILTGGFLETGLVCFFSLVIPACIVIKDKFITAIFGSFGVFLGVEWIGAGVEWIGVGVEWIGAGVEWIGAGVEWIGAGVEWIE